MNLTIKFFAQARDIAQQDVIEVTLPEGATIADVRHQIIKQIPELESIAPQLLMTVDYDFAADEIVVHDNSEITCFPPVSGG